MRDALAGSGRTGRRPRLSDGHAAVRVVEHLSRLV